MSRDEIIQAAAKAIGRKMVGQCFTPDDQLAEAAYDAMEPLIRQAAAEELDALRAEMEDQRAARKTAAESADRFRDVLSEALGHADCNPGDDVLVEQLRAHFGKTGPEPTRWREFVASARATVDQINSERQAARGHGRTT